MWKKNYAIFFSFFCSICLYCFCVCCYWSWAIESFLLVFRYDLSSASIKKQFVKKSSNTFIRKSSKIDSASIKCQNELISFDFITVFVICLLIFSTINLYQIRWNFCLIALWLWNRAKIKKNSKVVWVYWLKLATFKCNQIAEDKRIWTNDAIEILMRAIVECAF